MKTKEKNEKKEKEVNITAWNRAWLIIALALITLLTGIVLYIKNTSIVYNLVINKPYSALKFMPLAWIILLSNLSVTASYLFTNFKKGMTKNLYKTFILYYILFLISNLIIFKLSYIILSIIAIAINICLGSYLMGKLIKRYLLGAVLIAPTIIINLYLMYIYIYAQVLA